MARGLAYLHDTAYVVHGDDKSRNVMVSDDGRANLADLGCARRVGSKNGRSTAARRRSWRWRWPAVRSRAQRTVDVWALGCTVIMMVTERAT